MTVQFSNEKVRNHGSIPITIDCNAVAFIVFEEGFHQPIKRIQQSVFLDLYLSPQSKADFGTLDIAKEQLHGGFGASELNQTRCGLTEGEPFLHILSLGLFSRVPIYDINLCERYETLHRTRLDSVDPSAN
ncbi:hypothetical protein TNCV_3900841 [Trichonephila clavipes]|nr:hypothetical protein TNCV_3900841 [Trichonephila clavipes]